MIWSRGVNSIGLCNQLNPLLVLYMEFYQKITVVEVSTFCVWVTQGVSGGKVNILEGGTMDYSE